MDELDRVLAEHQARERLLASAERPPDRVSDLEQESLPKLYAQIKPWVLNEMARALDPEPNVDAIVEHLVESNAVIGEMLNEGPRPRRTRSSLPTTQWRKLYEGLAPAKLEVSLQGTRDGQNWEDIPPGGVIFWRDPNGGIHPIEAPGTHRERRLWYE